MVISLLIPAIAGCSKTKAQQIAEIDKEVKRINGLTLSKTVKSKNPEKEETIIPEEQAIIYYDTRNRIRKVIVSWELAVRNIFYFKTNGNLCYISFRNKGLNPPGGENSTSGTVYYKNQNPIKMDTIEYGPINRKVYKKNLFQEYGAYKTVQAFKKDYKVSGKLASKGKYTFTKPSKGDTTNINKNSVSIHSDPSCKSPILYALHGYESVTILEMKQWKEHTWYKVKVNYLYYGSENKKPKKVGWVFGAFIEPVEVKVK